METVLLLLWMVARFTNLSLARHQITMNAGQDSQREHTRMMKNPIASQENQHHIRLRAHSHWEQAGKPHGRDLEFWLQAEMETARATGPASRPVADSPADFARRAAPKKRPLRIHAGKPIPAAWQL
jgi:hypothetical protein